MARSLFTVGYEGATVDTFIAKLLENEIEIRLSGLVLTKPALRVIHTLIGV